MAQTVVAVVVVQTTFVVSIPVQTGVEVVVVLPPNMAMIVVPLSSHNTNHMVFP